MINPYRIILFSGALFLIVSCQSPSNDKTTPSGESTQVTPKGNENDLKDLPAGAFIEKFEDSPGIIRVSVKNGDDKFFITGTYKNGLRDGNWVEYHPSGLVKTITPYVEGKREGLFVELGVNGALEKRIMYHQDYRHGEYKEYTFAVLKEERQYEYDKVEGTVKIYYPDGKIMEEGTYRNGTRNGLSRWFDQNGNTTIQYQYQNGELVKK